MIARLTNLNEQEESARNIVCSECGYEGNEPHSRFCYICHSSLPTKEPENSNQNKLINISKKFSILAAGIITLSASMLFIVASVNSSPETTLKRARGMISFAGEPCSQRLINEKVSKAIKKINSRVRFRYTDNDKNKDQIQELIEGQIQIAFSEKAFLDSHFKRAKKRGVGITSIPYALDGIAYITDKKTKIRPLMEGELEDIFEGRITNWKQLGGEDKKIIPILMAGIWQNPMGIRLDDNLNPNTLFVKNRSRAKAILKETEGAVFYTSATLAAHELNEVNVIAIKKPDGEVVTPVLGKGVTNQKDIGSGNYPLVRSLNLIVNSEIFTKKQNHLNLQQKGVRAFTEYMVSAKGQAIVEDAGFVAKYELSN